MRQSLEASDPMKNARAVLPFVDVSLTGAGRLSPVQTSFGQLTANWR